MDPAASEHPRAMPPGVRPLRSHDPRVLGSCRLVGRIGSGGMGLAFLAEDSWGRRVVVKVVRDEWADDPSFVARFAREAQALAAVQDPRVVRVLSADLAADPPYLVTEYVPGPTLRQQVATHGALGCEEVATLARELAAAVAAMHDVGLTHRDLTPANIILSPEGPRVIDFGLAKAAEATDAPSTLLGTPGWVAPEGLQGKPVGTASDVFLWASLVAYAATGHSPFGEEPFDASARRALLGEPDLSGAPAELAALMGIVAKALSVDPLERPPARHIKAWLAPQAAAGTTRPVQPRPPASSDSVGTVRAASGEPVTERVAAADPATERVAPVAASAAAPGPGDLPMAGVRDLWRRNDEIRLLAYGGIAGIVVGILYGLTLGPLLDLGEARGQGFLFRAMAGIQEVLPLAAACAMLAALTLTPSRRSWKAVVRLLPSLVVISVGTSLLWSYLGSLLFDPYLPRNSGLMVPAAVTASLAVGIVLDSRGIGLAAFGAMSLAAPVAGLLVTSGGLPYEIYMVFYCLATTATLALFRILARRRIRARRPSSGQPPASVAPSAARGARA